MKSLLVPTDFSGNALSAANYAADLAAMLGARLHLLHVFTIPVQVSEVPIALDIQQMQDEAVKALNKIKEQIETRTSGRVQVITTLRIGMVLPEITQYADEINPYAIVMGAESAGSFERLLVGGKTVAALRKLSWPLIIIPPLATFNNIRKIGFACDFREVVESVRVKEIKELVQEFKAELHIIYIADKNSTSFSPGTIEESGMLREMLGDLKPKYHFIRETDIDNTINEYAERHKLDLLIVIPKKHTAIENLFSKRKSKSIVLHAHVPVLSLHE